MINVEEYIPLIPQVAAALSRRLPPRVEYGDLVQWGYFGLHRAAELFDETKRVKFTSYAQLLIRGAMLDGMRGLDWVPRSDRKRKIEAVKMGSIDVLISGGSSDNRKTSLVKGLEDETVEQPGQSFEDREYFDHLIRRLPKQSRYIIEGYYRRNRTMKEVAEELGLSESRVSQIHRLALRLLAESDGPNLNFEEDGECMPNETHVDAPLQNLVCSKFEGLKFFPGGAAKTAGVTVEELNEAVLNGTPVGPQNLVFIKIEDVAVIERTAPIPDGRKYKQRPVRCLDTGVVYDSPKAAANAMGKENASNLYAAIAKKFCWAGKYWEWVEGGVLKEKVETLGGFRPRVPVVQRLPATVLPANPVKSSNGEIYGQRLITVDPDKIRLKIESLRNQIAELEALLSGMARLEEFSV